jgi:hypothetical protein
MGHNHEYSLIGVLQVMCLAQRLEQHAAKARDVKKLKPSLVPLTEDLEEFIADWTSSVEGIPYGGRAWFSLATYLIRVGTNRSSFPHLGRAFISQILMSLKDQIAEMYNVECPIATPIIQLIDVSQSFAQCTGIV